MLARPRRLRLQGPCEVRPTERYRRKLVAGALTRLALGAVGLITLFWLLA
jgi:hypothetical protein